MDEVIARVELPRRRFTVEEYLRMAAAGILGPADRVELIIASNLPQKHAAAGITEAWIVDLERDMVDVFLEPAAAAYGATRRIGRGGRLSPLALPDIALSIDDAFLAR